MGCDMCKDAYWYACELAAEAGAKVRNSHKYKHERQHSYTKCELVLAMGLGPELGMRCVEQITGTRASCKAGAWLVLRGRGSG